jgi:predicted secreted protein
MKLIIFLLAASGLAACAGKVEDGSGGPQQHQSLAAPTPADVAMKITGEKKGENVSVKVGTKIAVELVGVPTAGYMWTVVDLPSFLEAVGEYGGPTSSAQLEPGFAGGNHWEGFVYAVKAAGEGEFRFAQRRAWEGEEEPPADEFSVYLFAEE